MLSPAAGGGTTPVLGSGAGVGSGTVSAKAVPRKLSPQMNATSTVAGPSLPKPLTAISFSR